MQHVHSAGERELSDPLGHNIDLRLLKGRQLPANLELRQDDLVAAGTVFTAIEDELQWNAFARDDEVGIVAAGDDDRDFLRASFRWPGGRLASPPEKEEVEKHPQRRTQADRCDSIESPDDRKAAGAEAHGRRRASRRLFPTTVREDAAIAAEAIIGESIQWSLGYSAPAAMGIARTL